MTKQATNMASSCIGPDSLLRGAFYAAEHAWHLLEDAVLLFQNKRYSNTLVLAEYCLEEVGRAKIYVQHRADGSAVTVNSLKSECKNHAFKLAQAEIPVAVGVPGGGLPPQPGSAEEAVLGEQLKMLRERMERKAPNRALDSRFKALYVDPHEDGVRWNRPHEVTREDADSWLGAAYVAYLFMRRRVLGAASAEELDQAFWGSERRQPKLPEPDWDIWCLDSIGEAQCHG
jgi:AbiV family abortive infection protein